MMTKPQQATSKNDEIVRSHYFMWLCDMVSCYEIPEDRANMEFLAWLHTKLFRWSIPNDDNRGIDGLKLRYEYGEQYLRSNIDPLDGPCSVFEMLVALAVRMDYNLSKAPDNHEVDRYFWLMIDNLGMRISAYGLAKLENEKHLDTFLDRTYGANGRGGLFPLTHPRRDQRKTEIWYQMMAYIAENYV